MERSKKYAAAGLAVGLIVGTAATATANSPFTNVIVESVKGVVTVDGTVKTAPAEADTTTILGVQGDCGSFGLEQLSKPYVIRAVSAGDENPSDGSSVRVTLYNGEAEQQRTVASFVFGAGETVQPDWELIANAVSIRGNAGCDVHLTGYAVDD